MKNPKRGTGMHSFLLWIFFLLFVVATNCLVYLSSLLDFKEGAQLVFVFSFYLIMYLGALTLLVSMWQFFQKKLVVEGFPGQKILVTYEVTFDEYEQIKIFLGEIRAPVVESQM